MFICASHRPHTHVTFLEFINTRKCCTSAVLMRRSVMNKESSRVEVQVWKAELQDSRGWGSSEGGKTLWHTLTVSREWVLSACSLQSFHGTVWHTNTKTCDPQVLALLSNTPMLSISHKHRIMQCVSLHWRHHASIVLWPEKGQRVRSSWCSEGLWGRKQREGGVKDDRWLCGWMNCPSGHLEIAPFGLPSLSFPISKPQHSIPWPAENIHTGRQHELLSLGVSQCSPALIMWAAKQKGLWCCSSSVNTENVLQLDLWNLWCFYRQCFRIFTLWIT